MDTISNTLGTEHLMKSDKSVSVNCRCSEYKEINNPESQFKAKGGGGIFFWGHHKIGLYLGVISLHFRVFF